MVKKLFLYKKIVFKLNYKMLRFLNYENLTKRMSLNRGEIRDLHSRIDIDQVLFMFNLI